MSSADARHARRARRLVAWFRQHARDLPWRRRRNGYTALVSEAMLQQTQVDRVVEPYRAFLRRFPSLRSLAAASEQDVLAAWQGLGYYRRARNLHAAARMIVGSFGGRVPRRADTLRRLPGVGPYTAGAIASIVYGAPEPIVDGNVLRVLARWDGADLGQKGAWARAGELVAHAADDSGPLNEGLMELGALVCTPQNPRCSSCPVASDCLARKAGRQHEIPSPGPAARRLAVHHHAVVVPRGETVLLEQRPESGLWSRMWQPPSVETADEIGSLEPSSFAHALVARGLPVTRLEPRGSFVHLTTHRHVTFHVYRGTTRARRGTWQPIEQLDRIPMSNAHRRVIDLVLAPVAPASALARAPAR